MADHDTEAIVVGPGPAGMSAAICLAGTTASAWCSTRVTAGTPRWHFHHHRVDAMERDDDLFVAVSQAGRWRGRAVIICTGVLDHYPHYYGWESYVGRSMFWRITCDDYSSEDKNILVVDHTDAAAGEAMQLSRFSNRLTLLTKSHSNEISPKYERRLANPASR